MKVALINPAGEGLKKNNEVVNAPYALITLASYLRKYSNAEIKIIDFMTNGSLKDITDFRPDIVGISSMTMFINAAYKIAKFCRKNTDAKIIIGGSHATALPEESIKHVDSVVVGEGETALLNMVNGKFRRGIIKGTPIAGIDKIPIPARDMIDMESYLKNEEQISGIKCRADKISTSRGCNNRCMFCTNSKHPMPIRFHSPKRVEEEVDDVVNNYGVEGISVLDENFLLSRSDRLKEVCNILKRNNLIWDCQTRVDLINYKTLKMMRNNNCVQIRIGFESGSQKILDNVKKNITLKQSADAIKACKRAGIRILGCFIFGLPGETEETIKETEKFIDENDIEFVSPFLATPYPGTSLWDYCKEKKLIPKNINWNDFTTDHQVDPFCCDTMPIEKLKSEHRRIEYKYLVRNYPKMYLLERIIRNPLRAVAFIMQK